jgi:hypothetical protein
MAFVAALVRLQPFSITARLHNAIIVESGTAVAFLLSLICFVVPTSSALRVIFEIVRMSVTSYLMVPLLYAHCAAIWAKRKKKELTTSSEKSVEGEVTTEVDPNEEVCL